MLRLLTLARDVTSIAFTPDGGHLLAVFNDDVWEGAVGVAWIDPRTGLSEHVAGVMHALTVAVRPDGSGFVYAVRREVAGAGDVRAYDAGTGGHRTLMWDDEWSVGTVAVARVAPTAAAHGWGRRGAAVRVWDGAGGREFDAGYAGTALAVSPAGDWVAIVTDPLGEVGVWDVRGERLGSVAARPEHLAWPLGDRLVALGGTVLSVWDPSAPATPVLWVPDAGARLRCADVSPDGRWVAAGGADGVVRVWGMGNPEPAASFAWDVGEIRGVAFAPDGLTCAAAGTGGRVVLWDFEA